MVKSLGKRSLATLLIMCLLFSLLPMTYAQAANHNSTDINKGDVLTAGDSITNNERDEGRKLNIYDTRSNFDVKISVGESYVLPADIGFSTYAVEYKDEVQIYLHGQRAVAYAVTVVNGMSDKDRYEAGQTVSIKADTKEGCEFTGWTADSEDVTFADADKTETTFVMPAHAVTVTANFKEIPKPAYAVTVVNGTADESTYTEGALVTVKATERVGVKFTGWVTNDKAITFKDAKALTTTFTMPGHATTVTATFQPVVEPYKITAGADGSHQAGSGKDLTFSCSGALEDLTGISVDGKQVDASHYHLESGSTILTLKASYLDTLSIGSHTLRFEYKTQSVETSFNITAKNDPLQPVNPSNNATNPGTGLTAGTGEAVVFSFIGVSVLLLGTVLISRKVTNKQ